MPDALQQDPATPSAATRKPKPAKKRILVFCDGTGNDFSAPNVLDGHPGSGRNSNVVKLYTAAKVNNEQVAYYHPGVGTMGAPTATHWLDRQWSKIKGLAFGAGFRDNVFDAYRYLMETYEENGGEGNEDEVFLFGFSRGAYTVRALAGLLDGYGLLCRGNEGHLPYAWRMYIEQHERAGRDQTRHIEPNESFRTTFSHPNFKIHFMGVWDTVSSVGWIYTPLRLFNVAQNNILEIGRHAVSIDEHRCFFQDNLWSEVPLPGQDLVQAWFAGVHSDIGGSYPQTEAGLADITLRWMLAEAKHAGLTTDELRESAILGGPAPPADSALRYDTPKDSRLHNSLMSAWKLLEIVPHIYFNQDYGREYMRVPLGLRRRQLPPGALVHASVAERMRSAGYAPPNLRHGKLEPPTSPLPAAQDGTSYLVFNAPARKRLHRFLLWLDRYVVTWAFSLFDLFILAPFLVFVIALMLIAPVLLVVRGLEALVHVPYISGAWKLLLHWPLLLWHGLLIVLHWCWHPFWPRR